MAHTTFIHNDLGKFPVNLMPAMIPAAVDTCTYRLCHRNLHLTFPEGQRSSLPHGGTLSSPHEVRPEGVKA